MHKFLSGVLLAGVIAMAIVSSPVLGQQTAVDPTFNAVPSVPLTTGTNLRQLVQPDGKILVFGTKLVVDGVAKSDVVRLNADGSPDPTFSYCGCGLDVVRNAMLAPGAKIIVAGIGGNSAKMIRLNPDGSIDPAFVAISPGPLPFLGGAEFSVNAVQPDGKVLATRRYSSAGHTSYTFSRYNSDGTLDSGFTSIALASGSPMSAFVRTELLPDGRFYLAVTSGVTGTSATLSRRNADGSVDPTWEAPSFQWGGFPSQVTISDIAVNSDGSILVAGSWNTVNGLDRRHLVRLHSVGNVDLGFVSPTVQAGIGVEVLPTGKLLFSGRVDIAGLSRLFRLNADGTVDNTYTMDAAVTTPINAWVADPSGRAVFLGQLGSNIRLVRLLADGALDSGFQPNIALFGTVHVLARQTDGKVIVAGVFSHMNGVARAGVARVNNDGSVDPTFDGGTGFSALPSRIVIQSDGKILAIGDFNSYNGVTVPGFVRIEANGSIDNTFNVSVSSKPLGLYLQTDGKILISGSFATVNGTARTGVARLNTDGTLDGAFNPVIGSPTVRSIVQLPDTKIIVGGTFAGVDGFNRPNLARLNANGSLDQGFNASGVGSVGEVWAQPNGKLIIGLGFPPAAIARRNADGSADTSFTTPTFSSNSGDTRIHSVLTLSDGSLLIGGRFDNVGQQIRPNITRLGPDGQFDILFMPIGANGQVRSLIPDAAGKVIAGGDFSAINNVPKPGVARLTISPYRVKTLYDFNGDGRADFTVYRPSTGVWYELWSDGTGNYESPIFGIAGDIPVPADFDGDGKTDEAIFRPSNGDWWYQRSTDGAHVNAHYGAAGDLARPGDFDGDGKADFIVFRPSTNTWYRYGTTVGEVPQLVFGAAGDQPVLGDFDGDGRVDPAIFRPSTGDWWYAASGAGGQHRAIHWGATGDIPTPADFDGDGKTDFAVFRPSNGAWYIYRSSDNSYFIQVFGLDSDRPVAADYDGDGRADIAVFRPSTGIWWVLLSTSGYLGVQWGVSTDVAVPNAYLP